MEPGTTTQPVADAAAVTDRDAGAAGSIAPDRAATVVAGRAVAHGPLAGASGQTARDRWHPVLRVAFRFGFLYLILYNIPFPLGSIPGTEALARPWSALWEAAVPWVGRAVLAVPYPITVLPNGSGDTTWNYVQVFCFLILAVAGTVLWTALDRRRAYPKLHVWLRIYVRLALGATMISYGAYKVIKSQFPFPSLDRLVQPFGDASPMGLLWTFMGYSDAYNVFTGLGELVGGVLLFFRRTSTLGALLTIAILANIVVLNFAYDVPVKLYSSHLLAMAIVLVLPDLRRLCNVLVLNRPAAAATLAAPFSTRRRNRVATTVKLAFLVLILGKSLHASASAHSTYGDGASEPTLFGLYDTEAFERNGVVVPATADDASRWRRVTVNRSGIVAIHRMRADHRVNYRLTTDPLARTARLTSIADSLQVHELSYELGNPALGDRLVLSGLFEGDSIRVTLRRRDPSDFLLVNRGFHWINEYPFNR